MKRPVLLLSLALFAGESKFEVRELSQADVIAIEAADKEFEAIEKQHGELYRRLQEAKEKANAVRREIGNRYGATTVSCFGLNVPKVHVQIRGRYALISEPSTDPCEELSVGISAAGSSANQSDFNGQRAWIQ